MLNWPLIVACTVLAYDVRSGHQMSPTGRSYTGSGYNAAGTYGYTSMSHSGTDYSQGMCWINAA